MSGGHFQYIYHSFGLFAEGLEREIENNDVKDEYGYSNDVPKHILEVYKKIAELSRKLAQAGKDIEWAYSDDIGHETAYERVVEIFPEFNIGDGKEEDSSRTEFINNPPELALQFMTATGIKTVADVYDDLSSEGATPFHFFAKLEEAIKNKKLVVYESDELGYPAWAVSDDTEYWFFTSKRKKDCERFVEAITEEA